MIGQTWVADGLRLAVEVAIDPDAAIGSIAGGTAEVVARRDFGGEIVAGAAEITGNTVIVTFPAGALAAGTWLLQVRVTVGSETQTVLSDRVTVQASLTAADAA